MDALVLATVLIAAAPSKLVTAGEQSGFTKTGRYDEVLRLCSAFQETHPKLVKCGDIGETPEGRKIALLTIADGDFDAPATRAKDKPVLLIQAGIHAGEIDGKDAGFWALRELLERRDAAELFSRFTLLFVPVYNPDGHERFGPHNRPNQRGPAEMGWRTTADNLNLNRDYMKADATETRAMLELLRAWEPVVYMDLHVTDGSDFQYDVAILTEPAEAGPDALRPHGTKLREFLISSVDKKGHPALPFYPSFIKDDDPSSGFELGTSPPRFALGYWAARNRIGVLVETHSWKPYVKRVQATRAAISALIDAAARDAAAWQRAAHVADEDGKKLAGRTDVAISWDTDGKSRTIDFRGFEYKREPSAISGRLATSYNPAKPQIWKVPLFESLKASLALSLPRAGYVVPPAQARWMGDALRRHGVEYRVIDRPLAQVELDVFRATETELRKDSYEGRTPIAVKGAWKKERAGVAKGWLWIPIAQARARLAAMLLDPSCPDSYLAWGFFNAFFERKEYMEAYVAEGVARQMLEKDPALAKEFAAKLESDAAFAANPTARLDFFYRKHPSWDDRFNRYPIMRSDTDLTQ